MPYSVYKCLLFPVILCFCHPRHPFCLTRHINVTALVSVICYQLPVYTVFAFPLFFISSHSHFLALQILFFCLLLSYIYPFSIINSSIFDVWFLFSFSSVVVNRIVLSSFSRYVYTVSSRRSDVHYSLFPAPPPGCSPALFCPHFLCRNGPPILNGICNTFLYTFVTFHRRCSVTSCYPPPHHRTISPVGFRK